MASLRAAARCIGLTGPFSVARQFFGFWIGTPAGMVVSVGRQVELLKGKHFNLNVIRTAPFTDAHLASIDQALQISRDIYAPANIGIGRIEHFRIPQGYEIILAEFVAVEMWDSWSVPNDGIDAFFCYLLVGVESGRSPEDGSCDKSDKDSGLVVGVLDNPTTLHLGQALAHEIGHYIGLGHEDALPGNLMFPSVTNGGTLYGGQIGAIKLHCSMRPGCPNY
jgi:hypothetical protein